MRTEMNGTDYLAVRRLQKMRGASDYLVAAFLDLVEAGSDQAPKEWSTLVGEAVQTKEGEIIHERNEERVELRRRHELADSFPF